MNPVHWLFDKLTHKCPPKIEKYEPLPLIMTETEKLRLKTSEQLNEIQDKWRLMYPDDEIYITNCWADSFIFIYRYPKDKLKMGFGCENKLCPAKFEWHPLCQACFMQDYMCRCK